MRHVRHHLSGTFTPLISTVRCKAAHASASASSIMRLLGTMPGSVVAVRTMKATVCR